jgi:hypothetical protein
MGDHPGVRQEQVEYRSALPKNKLFMQVDKDNWVHLYPLMSVHFCPTCGFRETYLLDYWGGPGEKTVLKSFERGHAIDSTDGGTAAVEVGTDIGAWLNHLFV